MIPILLIIIIYCILIILIYAKVKYDIQDKVIKSKNKFSIIIASKNEGLNIRNLIESLKKINYLNNYYEIIFVDDHSVDNTREIIQTEISNLKNAKYLFVTKKNYAGKKGAIDFGINNALYENIVITDSDCIVPPDWLNEINNKINEGVDFVIGISPFLQYKKLINQLSCFENLRSNIITIFSVKIKLPFTACARNLCFKKSFYNQINGFANLQKTLSGDDDLLLKEAINNKLSIDTLFNDKSFVFSKSKN
nr:glycosyltransferase [Melioribacteraceae bacterium]